MQSRFFKLLLFLTGIVLVIKIQEASSMDHEYVIQTWKGNSPNENLFNENKIINSQHEVSTVLQRTKRLAGYNDRNRRYPYPIPILGGGGYGSRGFGERGFGSRGFGARGFGSRGFGSKGFGARGFGSRGFGARGFGGRGIGGIGRGIGGFGGRGRG